MKSYLALEFSFTYEESYNLTKGTLCFLGKGNKESNKKKRARHFKGFFVSFERNANIQSIMSSFSSCRLMLVASLSRKQTKTLNFNKNKSEHLSTFDSRKFKLFQVSCFSWVTNKDASKMFGADAMFANVAKHICVFEKSCWYFPFKNVSSQSNTLKELHKRNKMNFYSKKFGRASGYLPSWLGIL